MFELTPDEVQEFSRSQFVSLNKGRGFNVKYGQEITFNFPLSDGQIKYFEDLEHDCEFYAVCSTTIGEVFESNKLTVKSLISSFLTRS